MTAIRTASITFAANGQEGMGYLAQPGDGGAHPGVVVIQEFWGLDGHIRDVAERFAREGFVALAPDLYHGAVATEPDEARKLAMNMNRQRAVQDCIGAVNHLKSMVEVAPKRVGCVGFCMGGSMTLALAAATADVVAAAPFYAGMQPGPDELARIEAELFCAFGADDAGIPLEKVRAFEQTLADTGRRAVVKVYDGAPHSFFNDTKPSYRPEAARDAWERTLELFRRAIK
ncbi:MAG: dienelactone hydrolase family protein [Dehalococcoidia bacterium]|nr:MAG: dienelactone hydrolase family protein [Dehalococcoidia bacterium]